MGSLLNERLKAYNRFAFKIDNWKEAPDCPGVYFIMQEYEDKSLFEYIGSSLCLIDRLRNHEVVRDIKKKSLDYFLTIYVLPMRNKDYRAAEAFFIQEFRPKRNKQKPTYDNYLLTQVQYGHE